MAFARHKTFRLAALVFLIPVVGVALVDLLGGPEVLGRFQDLVVAVAMVVGFVTLAPDDPSPGQRWVVCVGCAGAGVLLLAAVLDLVF